VSHLPPATSATSPHQPHPPVPATAPVSVN
jgi:hypothetical protein